MTWLPVPVVLHASHGERSLLQHKPRAFAHLHRCRALRLGGGISLASARSSGALRSNSNDPRQWLPRGFEETKTYDWLQRHFGSDEITVVSWPGCTLDDERTQQLARTLLSDPETSYFQRAISGRQILDQLVARPLEVPRAEAIRRLQGVLIGPDGATTCVMLTVSPRGATNRAAAVGEIRRVAQQVCGLQPEQLHLGGPTVDAATIDVESQRMLVELAGLSGLLALFITWIRLRDVRLAVIILVVAVYSTGASLAILYYCGGNMNLVMTMLPPLIFVLSISAAVHLTNYYRDALEETSPREAPVQALVHGWRPCALASGTTAVGLLSLAVSEIVPVKMFGIYASVGMLASLAIVLLWLPVAWTVWPATTRAIATVRQNRISVARIDRLVDLICRRHSAIFIGALVLLVVTGIGLFSLRSTVKLQYRFGAHSRILQDYQWLEEHLGPLVPLELVVHFGEKAQLTFHDQLEQVAALERMVQQLPNVGAALSGADFAPYLPAGRSTRVAARRAIVRRSASIIEERLRQNGFCAAGDNGERLWRISIRAPALSDVDYGRFVDELRQCVEPFVNDLSGVHVTYTGVIPLIYKAQRELLNDLVESFLMAFGVITLVMIVVLQGVRSGLLAMVPNIFPAVIVFGLMGWCNIWIEIGSIMTASAAMGIAVDDTFHLLAWHRRGLRESMPRRDAMRFAMHRCAGAMVHTSLICSCALLVFSLSSFMPIRRFAWLMASLLIAALLGDLILMPAILAGPFGRLFRSGLRGKTVSNTGADLAKSGQASPTDQLNEMA